MKNTFHKMKFFYTEIRNLYCYIKTRAATLHFYTNKSNMVSLFVCFRAFVVFLLSLDRKTVPVFELSPQLREEMSPEATRDKRLQRQGAALQMSLLHVHVAVSFGHLQTRETPARESASFCYWRVAHEQLSSQRQRELGEAQIKRMVAEYLAVIRKFTATLGNLSV